MDRTGLDNKVQVPENVTARQIGGETVILDLASGTYFGLDALGTRIWQLIVEKRPLTEVRDTLLAEYEVQRAQVEADLLRLVDELRAAGLVQVE